MKIKGTSLQLFKVFIIFVISILSLLLIKDKIRSSLAFNYKLNSPSGIFVGNGNRIFVIDRAKKSILILDNEFRLINIIKGSKEKKSFYYASLVTEDNEGNIYIADTIYSGSGTKISKERILKYDEKGRFKEIIYEIKYDEEKAPLQYGNILSLDIFDNKVIFTLKSKNYIEVVSFSLDTKIKESKSFNLYEMNPSSIALNMETLEPIVISRKGDIYIVNDNKDLEVFLPREKAGTAWKISWAGNKIYYTELESKEIREVDTNGNIKTIYTGEEILYTISGKEENLFSTDYYGLINIRKNETFYLTKLKSGNRYTRVLLGIFIINTCFSFLYLLLNFLFKLKSILKHDAVQKSLIIIISSLLVSVLVGYLSFSTMLSYVNKNTMKDLNLFSDLLIEEIDIKKLENIKNISDYRGEDYLQIKKLLDTRIEKSYENSLYYYYIIYKASNHMIYGIMDYEDTMTSKHPFYNWGENSYTEVLSQGKTIEISNDISAYGTWSFVLKPIFDINGKPFALVEVGVNTDEVKKNQRKFILSTIAIISCSVVVMIILMLEVIFAMKYKERKEKLKEEKNANINYKFPLRSLIFICFFADSMQDSFIPILSSKRYEVFFNIPESIGVALPITLQLLNSALFSFLGGSIINKIGIKKTMIFGFFSQMIAYIICAYTSGFLGLIIGKSISGIGMGLIIVGVNTIAAVAEEEAHSAISFGEINAGILAGVTAGVGIGSVVLSLWNYSGVYYIAALFIFLGLIYSLLGEDYLPTKVKNRKANIKIYKFIFNKKTLSFLVFILMPFLVALSYREYFFPLYAKSQGFSEANIGYLYLLSGLIVIYLGPILTNYLIAEIGTKKTLILASITMTFDTLLFAVAASLYTAIIGIFTLSISISFGYAVQSTYYTSLPTVEEYGEAKAMGVYAIFDSGGQTLGPIIYGASFMLGYQKGLGLIAGFLLIFIFAFIFLNLRGDTNV